MYQPLEPLGFDEAEKLVAALLGPNPSRDSVAAQVITLMEHGVPHFVLFFPV